MLPRDGPQRDIALFRDTQQLPLEVRHVSVIESPTPAAAPSPTAGAPGSSRQPRVRAEADLAAGVFLLVCAGLAWWFGQPLKVGTAYRMGPGYVPILLSWVMGAFGLVLCLLGLLRRGPALANWRFKPMALVLGSLVVFALTIERTGLLIASLLAVALAGLAAPRRTLRSVLLLAVALAAFACLLFPFALQLPLRILP